MLIIVIGFLLLILGLSYLFQAKLWVVLKEDCLKAPEAVLPFAFVMLVLGLTIIANHNVWITDWPLVITLFGWLLAVKGGFYLLYPQAVYWIKSRSDGFLLTWVRVAGVFLVVIGGLLLRFYWS